MNDLRPLNILMVEDNSDHAELMMDALLEFNVRNTVAHVTNGERALDYLCGRPPFDNPSQHFVPDIVFLDLRMPRQDGITTLKLIKEDPQIKHIPVVMISTSKTDKEIQQCYALGASGYITKPLQFEEFSKKIRELNCYWVLTCEIGSSKD